MFQTVPSGGGRDTGRAGRNEAHEASDQNQGRSRSGEAVLSEAGWETSRPQRSPKEDHPQEDTRRGARPTLSLETDTWRKSEDAVEPSDTAAGGPGGRWVRLHLADLPASLARFPAFPQDLRDTLREMTRHPGERTYQHTIGRWRTLEVPVLHAEQTPPRRRARRRGDSDWIAYLTVVVGPGLLVTLEPTASGPAQALVDALETVLGFSATRARTRPDEGRRVAVGRALVLLLALAVERIEPALHRLEAVTGRLETLQPDARTDPVARAILLHKRRLAALAGAIAALRDGVAMLEENPPNGMGPQFRRRLRDVDRHIAQSLHRVEAERDQVSAILSYHLSAASQRVNEVIKTLTVLATVVTPFTVISGIYGMNFTIPETHWRYGYVFALGLMAASTGFLLWFFRRHRWI